jgi:DNA-binding YbaB/EbfC family protein
MRPQTGPPGHPSPTEQRPGTNATAHTLTTPIGGNVNPDGQLDMQQLLAAAQQMQEQLMNAQQELADAEVSGTAGGGLVTAQVNGQGELVDLSIAPSVIDPDDLEETAQTIADLVLAAVRDAYGRAGDLQQEKMGPFATALGGGMPGMPEMPVMPGMPGGLGTPGASGLGGPGLPGTGSDEPHGE